MAAVWGFSDESERANLMLLAVVIVAPADVDRSRAEMRRLLLPGQRRIHTTDESDRRRRSLLGAITRIQGISAIVLRHRRGDGVGRIASRHHLLAASVALVVERQVTAWTLDDVPPTQRSRDRHTIGRELQHLRPRQEVVYDHRRSQSEPLLWAADAVAWAVGAGGDWRRRIATVAEVRDVGL